jgi:hypothetical protein
MRYVSGMRDVRYEYTLGRKLEGKRPLGRLPQDGRLTLNRI